MSLLRKLAGPPVRVHKPWNILSGLRLARTVVMSINLFTLPSIILQAVAWTICHLSRHLHSHHHYSFRLSLLQMIGLLYSVCLNSQIFFCILIVSWKTEAESLNSCSVLTTIEYVDVTTVLKLRFPSGNILEHSISCSSQTFFVANAIIYFANASVTQISIDPTQKLAIKRTSNFMLCTSGCTSKRHEPLVFEWKYTRHI